MVLETCNKLKNDKEAIIRYKYPSELEPLPHLPQYIKNNLKDGKNFAVC